MRSLAPGRAIARTSRRKWGFLSWRLAAQYQRLQILTAMILPEFPSRSWPVASLNHQSSPSDCTAAMILGTEAPARMPAFCNAVRHSRAPGFTTLPSSPLCLADTENCCEYLDFSSRDEDRRRTKGS